MESYEKGKTYSEQFLREYNYTEKMAKIWATLDDQGISLDRDELDRIYRLNSSWMQDWTVKRVDYYIRNHFWSLLDFFEVDSFNWSDEQVFDTPSLVTYGVFGKNKKITIIVVSLKEQRYQLLKSYKLKRLPLWRFKKRQLTYEKDKGFLSI